MNKVILTREQAKAVECARKDSSNLDRLVLYHAERLERGNGWVIDEVKALNELSLDKLIKALYIGYEVEPDFKVGDWVVHDNGHPIRQVIGFSNNHLEVSDDEDGYIWSKPFVRHATPSEIAEEKERRWWAKHGRKPWELKNRDLLLDDTHTVGEIEICDGELYLNGCDESFDYIKEYCRVVCFAEQRLDVKDDE